MSKEISEKILTEICNQRGTYSDEVPSKPAYIVWLDKADVIEIIHKHIDKEK